MSGAALSERIAGILGVDPSANAIESSGAWCTWGELSATIDSLTPSIEPGMPVGLVLRNRPGPVASLLAVLRAGGCAVMINPGRGRERTRAEIAELALPLVCGHPDDLDELVPSDAAGSIASVTDAGPAATVRRVHGASTAAARPGTAVRMLTSGTTGPPKRIDLGYGMLERVLVGAKHYESNRDTTLRLRTGVAVVNAPLVHVAGVFRVLQCVTDGRPFALLDRFTVEGWVDAVRRHRPATASLVPTALRMVLDTDLDPADLSSLRSVVSGTAPLDPTDADAFTEKYGIPVLVTYGATEFGGGVAGWNVEDHRAFWSTKRGSVGRAHAGCELRVVDEESGVVLGVEAEGVLEVKAAQLGGREWVRTTDLARIDADGFLYILGRTDQAIIRGGFKIRPDDVRAALERHPAVSGAAVVRRDDRRLGAVPVAAVELRGEAPTTPPELLEFLTEHVARYELPVEIRIVPELPRTDSGKADLAAVAALMNDGS